jgi:class 3 adenylate cyclase
MTGGDVMMGALTLSSPVIKNEADAAASYDAAMSSSVRTLLFSDIEGSTGLLQRAGEQYPGLLLRHREIVREAIRATGGIEHGTEGDSFFVSFDSPSSALAAAVQVQREVEACDWPDGLRLRVRIGLHLGEVEDLDGDLVGLALHHAARIAATAHGGQIIVSESVQSMVRVLPAESSLRMLGQRRLRDVGVVTLFQVEHPDLQDSFPELRGILGNRTNLPRIATAFVGGSRC